MKSGHTNLNSLTLARSRSNNSTRALDPYNVRMGLRVSAKSYNRVLLVFFPPVSTILGETVGKKGKNIREPYIRYIKISSHVRVCCATKQAGSLLPLF